MSPIVRGYFFKVFASVIYYAGLLKLLKCFVNRFKVKRDGNGACGFPFVAKRGCRNIQILLYHRINDEGDAFFPGISITTFRSEMEYLGSNCIVLSLEDAVHRLGCGDVPDNAVVVTFDDGYKDNFLNAFPILKQLSIPATIFLATEVIGSERVLWHDRVFSAFRETHVLALSRILGQRRSYSLRTLEEKLLAQQEVLKLLWALDSDDRLFWIDRLLYELEVNDQDRRPNLMLNWDEIATMERHGITFGSHTVTHPILSRITAERIMSEIQCSKATIEQHLKVPVRTFAYPIGRMQDFDENVKTQLKNIGYICALTTIPGANEPGQDPFELKRATPWETYLPAFATKLNWYKFC